MILKYGGNCSECGQRIEKGQDAAYDRDSKSISRNPGQCPKDLLSDVNADELAIKLGFFNAKLLDAETEINK